MFCIWLLQVHLNASKGSYEFIVSPFSPLQAASLPMSIIIVGVGPAEFDGECTLAQEGGGGGWSHTSDRKWLYLLKTKPPKSSNHTHLGDWRGIQLHNNQWHFTELGNWIIRFLHIMLVGIHRWKTGFNEKRAGEWYKFSFTLKCALRHAAEQNDCWQEVCRE